MAYIPTIVIDDDNEEVLKLFRLKSSSNGVKVVTFTSWDKTKEYLESGKEVDAVVLDAKGQLTADSNPGEAHLFESFTWVKTTKLPYAIYTAYTDSLEMLSQQVAEGRVFTKGKHKEEDVFSFLKQEITKSPKAKFPEPFTCFGGKYLDLSYQDMLMNVVLTLQNEDLRKPENILFNPCRMILESVFRKIADIDNTVLPYALINFDRQRAGLSNCFKHMSGIHYYLNNVKEYPSNFFKDSGNEIISKQIDLIITGCHPASHEIQNYSPYTFKSVLWALFDVLIWLKEFIDKRS